MSASTAPRWIQARATAKCPALIAATQSVTPAKISKSQSGMLIRLLLPHCLSRQYLGR